MEKRKIHWNSFDTICNTKQNHSTSDRYNHPIHPTTWMIVVVPQKH